MKLLSFIKLNKLRKNIKFDTQSTFKISEMS